jgi:signal transduction histidine kinase
MKLDSIASVLGTKEQIAEDVSQCIRSRLPRDRELALFRVLQESLTNVHRHSGSKTATVRLLTRDSMGILEIEDTGQGVSQQLLEQAGEDWMGALGVGVRGMNERMRQLGGTLELISNQSGTTVRAKMPVTSSPSVPSSLVSGL